MVEPPSFFEVELGSGLGNPFQSKGLDEFFHGKHFGIVGWVPAQKCHKVYHGLREPTIFAVTGSGFAVLAFPLDGKNREAQAIAIAFGELAIAFGFKNEGQVSETRHGIFPTQGLVKEHMQGSGREPFFPANNVGNFHGVVVHYIGQMIGGHAIAFKEHFIVYMVGFYHYHSTHYIFYPNFLVSGHIESNYVRVTCVQPSLHLIGG